MRPILFVLLLTTILVSPAALGAQPGAMSRPGSGPGPGPGFGPAGPPAGPGHCLLPDDAFGEELASRRIEVLTDYLELSESQRAELEAIVEEQRELREADREGLRGEAERLRELLDGESPDAAEVGRLVLDLHRAKESLMAQRAAERERIEALLTPDQLERFEALEAARQMRPPHPPFHHHPGPGAAPPARDGG